MLLKALSATLSASSTLKEQASLKPEAVQLKLADAIADVLQKCSKYWKKKPQELSTGSYLYTLLTALDSSDALALGQLDSKPVPVDQLVQASNRGIQSGRLYGWKLRVFLLKYYPSAVDKVLDHSSADVDMDGEPLDVVGDSDLIPLVLECTEATLHTLDSEKERLLYLRDLVEKLEFGADVETQLTSVRCAVAKLSG